MKFCVFGAGVIGVTYSYQLARSGHDVIHLVRKGKRAAYERDGIPMKLLDMRPRQPLHSELIYRPAFIDTLKDAEDVDFLFVSVNSHQLGGLLGELSGYRGRGHIVFLQNMRPGEENVIAASLDRRRYFYGYPFKAGGGRSDRSVKAVIFGDFLSNTKIGEVDGSVTARLGLLCDALADADMKPRITRRIIPYIRTHYVWAAASLGAYMKAGSYDRFVAGDRFIRESYIAMRQAMETCLREGINPLLVSPVFLFYTPLFLLAPFTARSFRTEGMRRMWEGHIGHSPEEMRTMYFDILAEGDRLGVAMPAYRAFRPYVESFLENHGGPNGK